MKLGFSLLSLFMKDVNEMLDIAVENGFDSVELLQLKMALIVLNCWLKAHTDLMKCLETRK